MKKREIWADNAKFLGIALVVLGHNNLASSIITDTDYSITMPLFFTLSGYFASMREKSISEVLKYNFRILIIPFLFLYYITLPYYYLVFYTSDNFQFEGLWDLFYQPIVGGIILTNTKYSVITNGPLWYLVVLFWVKILFYYCSKFKYSDKSLILSICLILSVFFFFKIINIHPYWRINTALMAYPFFIMGVLLKRHSLLRVLFSLNNLQKVVMAFFLMLLCVVFSFFNGHIEFFYADYGRSYLLMACAGIVGTLSVFLVSNVIPENKTILIMGRGTVVILGMHGIIQPILKKIFLQLFNIHTENYSIGIALIMVTIIMFSNIPIILFLNKFFSCCIGKRRDTPLSKYPSNSH